MFSFFSKREKEYYSLVIDIQSGLVRGALVLHKEHHPPVIQCVTTKLIPRKLHTNSNYINKMMLKALSAVLEFTTESKKISKIDIILSSPWVLSHSKAIKLKFDKNTTITQRIVSNLVDDEKTKLETEYKNSHRFIPNTQSDLNYIEQKVFDIKLNGYEVNEYIGRIAKELEISTAMTLSSKIILARIGTVLSKFSSTNIIKYHSGLLLNFIALRKMLPDNNDYVYIHVHSELTDVIVVKKGLCANISSFPMGTANLVRRVAHTLRQSDEIADSEMSLYLGNKLEEQETRKISKIVNEFSEGWSTLYKKIIDSSLEIGGTPRLIFLSAHGHTGIFKEILNRLKTDEIHIVDFSLETISTNITFEKTSENNQLIKMYTLALEDVI